MNESIQRSFASDNNASIWPEVLQSLSAINEGHAKAYGGDPWTERAMEYFRREFGPQSQTFFVFNGTAANVLCLKSCLKPFESVICAATSHLNVDECGAPEHIAGVKLQTLASPDGKLRPEQIEKILVRKGDIHFTQPRMVSISQPTELGTVYQIEELRRLSEFCRQNRLWLHVDGARLPVAAVSLGVSLGEAVQGADLLSFGGTKNGLYIAEAVVFLNPTLGADFGFYRKQNLQLGSKMRYTSAQFVTFFERELWKRGAENSHRMAKLLAQGASQIPGIRVTQAVQANAVFALLPKEVTLRVREKFFFYVWDESTWEVRWMTSFDTREEDVREFLSLLKAEMAQLSWQA